MWWDRVVNPPFDIARRIPQIGGLPLVELELSDPASISALFVLLEKTSHVPVNPSC